MNKNEPADQWFFTVNHGNNQEEEKETLFFCHKNVKK